MVNIINPFSSAADATVYARQGNLLGTATQFGEGLLKAVALTKAPGALNALMARNVSLGALGVTDVGTIAGATGIASGTLALPTTAKALYKAGQTGNKEDIRAAVNQVGMNALDFIAPEVIGSKGALSALMKGEKLSPLQQLSRQNILTGSTANNLNDLRLSTPALDNALDMSRNIRSYREQSAAPAFASLEDGSQSQLMDLMNNRREVDRTIQELRNQGNTNSPYFQGAIDERDYLTRQIDDLNTQTRDRIAALRQSALRNYTDSQSEFPITFEGSLPSSSSAPTPRSTPRTVLSVQTDAELQDALTEANKRIAAFPDDSQERRRFEVFASEINSTLNARMNYTNAVNQIDDLRRTPNLLNLPEESIDAWSKAMKQAETKLSKAKENLKNADPGYFKINETSRQLLNQERQRVIERSLTKVVSFDLTRPTPGVTEYTGTNLPAPIRTSQIYSDMARPGASPVKFSEATREAIRRRPDRTRMSIEAQLRDADNPIDFVNRLRSQYANGNINREVYDELLGGLREAVKPTSDMYEDFDFFKEIAATNPDKPYTGSMLSRNEVLNELMSIPDEALDDVLRTAYGYGLDDIEFLFNNPGISDQAIKIGMNQVLDDYTFMAKYNTPNPNAPALDFANRQTVSPQLRGNGDDLGMLNISKKSLDKIQKTRYSNQPQTTDAIYYNDTQVDNLPKVLDKKIIVNNKELKEQIDAYEEAFSQIPKGSLNPVHRDIKNKLEDLKATQWLRTEYAQELRAAGLSPDEIEKITIVTSGPSAKSMVDKDGNVIGTLNFSEGIYEGKKYSQISSTGLSTKYHGYSLKNSGFKNWDEAQDALAKRYLDEELSKTKNASDKNNPIYVKSLTKKANTKAAEEIALLQRNNNNRFGEALYRGVHHGIKDTRGGIGTREGFAETNLIDPITGLKVKRYRAKDYWESQMRQTNDKGVAKAGRMYGPQTQSDMQWGNEGPIFVLRKKGGDVPKLLRFTQ
jgi:hypothetical protein